MIQNKHKIISETNAKVIEERMDELSRQGYVVTHFVSKEGKYDVLMVKTVIDNQINPRVQLNFTESDIEELTNADDDIEVFNWCPLDQFGNQIDVNIYRSENATE